MNFSPQFTVDAAWQTILTVNGTYYCFLGLLLDGRPSEKLFQLIGENQTF